MELIQIGKIVFDTRLHYLDIATNGDECLRIFATIDR